MFRCQISRHLLRRATTIQPRLHPRTLSTTPISFYPRKDSQDKDSINTSSNEYSKSGSDDAAATSQAAFDSSTTSPEKAERTAEAEQDGNSLNVSPGNPEVSKPRDEQEGGAEASPKGKGDAQSGKGSAKKAGGGKSG
ncbi:hypothetical protein P280DRAFT_411255 [Massarina eburnea CBS 473.64]|uniref:Uncharacterized protein n=1 Tax=Massarina eburnea CBS 473.64 TaxID=1395130 RepID=A0A6A6RJ71_9PLEO|nr:hypothetical protein P280DRAFT_411255 [Massarina eburnea CBS 473.64]